MNPSQHKPQRALEAVVNLPKERLNMLEQEIDKHLTLIDSLRCQTELHEQQLLSLLRKQRILESQLCE